MKTCFRCGEKKPLTDFYRHSGMADGHLGKCKECTKSEAAVRRAANLTASREREARQSRNPQQTAEHQRRQRARYPERYRARTALGNAVRDGRVVRQPCERCGAAPADGHHDDYSKPLVVRWLCKLHHEAEHHEGRA